MMTELVIFSASFLRGTPKVPTSTPVNFLMPTKKPVYLRSQWPWTGYGSFAWPLGASTVTTTTGSSSSLDLINWAARTSETALIVKLPSTADHFELGPTGTGYLYLTGTPGTLVSWTQVVPSESSIAIGLKNTIQRQKALNDAFMTIDLSRVIGLIDFSTTIASGRIKIWSDEYSTPTFGRYIMQPFLEGHSAFSITISGINNSFLIGATGDPLEIATIANGLFLTPSSFEAAVQAAVDSAIGAGVVSVSLTSYDAENPEMLHVGLLLWSATSGTYQVSLPDSTSAIRCATAATLGLYKFDGITNATLVSTMTVASNTYSPSAAIVQWPATWTIRAFANPGSANTDGVVRLYPEGSSVPSLVLGACDSQYCIYGPESTIGPFSTGIVRNSTGERIRAQLYVTVTATTATSQTLTSISVIPEQTDIWTLLLAEAVDPVPVSLSLNGLLGETFGSTQTLSAHFDGGLRFTKTGLSFLIGTDLDPKSILDDFQTELVFGDALGATITTNISLGGLGKKVKRHSYADDPMSYSYLQSTTIEAWAGGGGSILNSAPPTYGGASARAQMNIAGDIQSLIVDVGARGSLLTTNCATGGRSTRVTINGITLLHLGGGGGAAAGSFGGQGGGPIGGESLDDTQPILAWPGYSASLHPFSPRPSLNPQTLGPTQKPFDVIGTASGPSGPIDLVSFELFQGSGAGLGVLGDDGYYVTTNDSRMNQRNGGLGGFGYGGTLGPIEPTIFGGAGSIA